MHMQAFYLLTLSAVLRVSTAETTDELITNTTKPALTMPMLLTDNEESLAVLEEALSALGNLTDIQKRVWEQQRAYEQQVAIRNREEENREAKRSASLEVEHVFLRDIWGTLSRRIKSLTKSVRNANKDPQAFNNRYKDCADLYLDGEDVSGVYQIWPTWSNTNFSVYCDMETDGGGWTVIHRWGNYSFPKNYFRRSWDEYKNGFGNLDTAFWLGNDKTYALTRQGAYELRFDVDEHPTNKFSKYRGFWIDRESQNYKVYVEGYVDTGTGGDIFSTTNGLDFSTWDRRNNNCNYEHIRPGWWFSSSCQQSANQVFILSFPASGNVDYPVFKREMKIRPANFQKMKEIS